LKNYLKSAVVFTQANQLFRGLSGIFTLILIPLFLTKEQQGYWFTMTSLAALAMLAELGFFQVTLQFAAHEFAYLKFEGNDIVGSEDRKKRLASLFVFCTKWALSVAVVAFPVILLVGFLFLSQQKTGVTWSIPWVVYVAGGSVTFFTSAILCFLEGCNLVATIQRLRLLIAAITMVLMWLGLVFRFGLYALSLSMLAGALCGIYMVWRRYGPLFGTFITESRAAAYSWGRHILPLLWRYALSWSSGYFIFQVYPPLAFQFHGPVEAGKVGLSLTLWMGVLAISNSWLYAVTPRLNMLVSKRDWAGLDALFWRNLALSGATYLTGAIAVLTLIRLMQGRYAIIDRFSDPLSMLLLAIIWFLQVIINGLATYLRAHKQEPLVLPSVLSAIYVTLTTVVCAKYFAPQYFFLGWLSCCVWGVPWVLCIFRTKKRVWQTA
jgi:hypothetical protein